MNDGIKELIKKQEKQAKIAIIIGIIFIITSALFMIIGTMTGKTMVLVGALMQLFAGAMLIINNSM